MTVDDSIAQKAAFVFSTISRMLPADLHGKNVVVIVAARDTDALVPSILSMVESRGGNVRFACLSPTKDYEGLNGLSWIVRIDLTEALPPANDLAILVMSDLVEADWAFSMTRKFRQRLAQVPLHVVAAEARSSAWSELQESLSSSDFGPLTFDAGKLLDDEAPDLVVDYVFDVPNLIVRRHRAAVMAKRAK